MYQCTRVQFLVYVMYPFRTCTHLCLLLFFPPLQPQLSKHQQFEHDLTEKIKYTMDKHKEVFFVIRLHPANVAETLGPIIDQDQLINCDLMDGRDAFLTLAREKHYEFSSLRRAKFSSVALLFELHNSEYWSSGDGDGGGDTCSMLTSLFSSPLITGTNGGFVYTCNKCKRHVLDTRYHCTECDDFDLCAACYQKEGHPHRMDKVGDLFGTGGADPSAVANTSGEIVPGGNNAVLSATEARKLNIQRCIQSLVHACQCRDANCQMQACKKMKGVVEHAKKCKRKQGPQNPNANCPICKQFIVLCCYHARGCNEAKCTVPYCLNIKNKLKQQQQLHRYQQQQILRRRIANMNSMQAAINASSSSNPSGNSNTASQSSQSSQEFQTPPAVSTSGHLVVERMLTHLSLSPSTGPQ